MPRRQAWILLVLGVLMGLVAPPTLFLAGRSKAARVSELQREGRQAAAQAVDIEHLSRGAVKIRYAFTVGGRTFVNAEDTPQETAERLQGEASFPVVYLPRDPNVVTYDLKGLAESAKVSTTWGPWLFAAFGLFCGSIGFARLKET